MITSYIFTMEDLAKEYFESLDFDPLYWLEKDENTFTMGDLFKLSQPCEDKKCDRSIRYSDDNVCFELLFELLEDGSKFFNCTNEDTNWYYCYIDKSSGKDVYYLLTAVSEL